jgi:hypothetical protein
VALQERGVKSGARLVWMPAGALGLLPLGLAQDPATGRRFGDSYEIVTAPSLEALAAASRRIAEVVEPSLAETVNPAGDIRALNLPFAEIEGALVAVHFAGQPEIQLDKSNVLPEAVLAALKGKSYWHFSSHGRFDWNDARRSGLIMKGDTTLTVGSLLDNEQSLGRPRPCRTLGLRDRPLRRSPQPRRVRRAAKHLHAARRRWRGRHALGSRRPRDRAFHG